MHLNRSESNILVWLISLFCFWLLVFFIQRQVFLLFHLAEVRDLPWNEVILSNWYALSMDISTAAYLVFLPFIILSLTLVTKKQVSSMKIVHLLNVFLLSLCIITGNFDIGLSLQWGTKLNAMALSFVDSSGEFTSLIFSSSNLWLFTVFILMLSAFLWLYYIFLTRKVLKIKSLKQFSLTALLSLILLVVAVRGGLGSLPLARSSVYYSIHPLLNNASLNGLWNLGEILAQPVSITNPYQFFSEEKASDLLKLTISNPPDSSKSTLQIQRPNIVMIIVESMGADVFSTLNGEPGIAPGIDSLTAKGLLFTSIYAAGTRTDHGLLALFSGFPSLPQQRIIMDFNRIENLPHIYSVLAREGYHTSYILGGNLDYSNTRSYMLMGKTRFLMDGNDFPVIRRTSWGAYDEELFAEHLKIAASFPQPFFSAISTITNHEEFEADVPKIWLRKGEIYRFRNTARYTDQCVIKYLKEAAGQAWFKNTLFVIVADHAHVYPFKRQYYEPRRYHIPLLLYGDALKPEFRGKKIDHTGSQCDIPYTLLKQLAIDPAEFTWGKDLLEPASPRNAWYSFDHGFGFITPAGYVVYDHNQKKTIQESNFLAPADFNRLNDEGKAILQLLYRDYLQLGIKRTDQPK
jgi:phosphoglycerol transferase MdoB-like AlkP superfamily enzyme